MEQGYSNEKMLVNLLYESSSSPLTFKNEKTSSKIKELYEVDVWYYWAKALRGKP